MYQFIKFHFVLRKVKSDPKKGIIYIRLTQRTIKVEFTTRLNISVDLWNPKIQKVKGTGKLAQVINAQLEHLRFQYESHRRYLMENQIALTPKILRDSLLGVQKDAQITLLDAIDHHLKRVIELKNIDYSPATVEKYKRVKAYIIDYLSCKNIALDFPISSLNYPFVRDFDVYLRTQKKQSNNTAVKFIRTFKTIINAAKLNDWIQHDPFAHFKGTVKTKERRKLSSTQLQPIQDKPFSNVRIDRIRDAFLFACYTGLAFADMKKLKTTDIQKNTDGTNWLVKPRTKTGVLFRIPLLPVALKIIEKYQNDPECRTKGILLPIPSNQKYNAYLKEIMTLCDIDFNLTSHIARHTFATTVALENGVSLETVSKILGHSNTNITQHYGKITETRISDEMKKLSERLKLQAEEHSEKEDLS